MTRTDLPSNSPAQDKWWWGRRTCQPGSSLKCSGRLQCSK